MTSAKATLPVGWIGAPAASSGPLRRTAVPFASTMTTTGLVGSRHGSPERFSTTTSAPRLPAAAPHLPPTTWRSSIPQGRSPPAVGVGIVAGGVAGGVDGSDADDGSAGLVVGEPGATEPGTTDRAERLGPAASEHPASTSAEKRTAPSGPAAPRPRRCRALEGRIMAAAPGQLSMDVDGVSPTALVRRAARPFCRIAPMPSAGGPSGSTVRRRRRRRHTSLSPGRGRRRRESRRPQ
jgi:hypothetical protein